VLGRENRSPVLSKGLPTKQRDQARAQSKTRSADGHGGEEPCFATASSGSSGRVAFGVALSVPGPVCSRADCSVAAPRLVGKATESIVRAFDLDVGRQVVFAVGRGRLSGVARGAATTAPGERLPGRTRVTEQRTSRSACLLLSLPKGSCSPHALALGFETGPAGLVDVSPLSKKALFDCVSGKPSAQTRLTEEGPAQRSSMRRSAAV